MYQIDFFTLMSFFFQFEVFFNFGFQMHEPI